MKTQHTNGTVYRKGRKMYKLSIPEWNPHDLWFWPCDKFGVEYDSSPRRRVVRVYLGSRNIAADNVAWLADLVATL